jgi:peptide/nickel transport system permease protein
MAGGTEMRSINNWLRALVWKVVSLTTLALLGGLITATLVRYSPGYGVDERELDPRLSSSSVEALRNQRRSQSNLLRYYGAYLTGAAHGDFGVSESLQQPISRILRERLPVTIRSVLAAILTAWIAAFLLGIVGAFQRGWLFELSTTVSTGFLLSMPSAVIGLFFVYLRGPVFLAIAFVTFPKLFRYVRNLLLHASEQPHVLAARTRGVSQSRILLRHVIFPVAPSLLALLGVSISLAFGAAVPIEALCDSAGIGQLAWYAAINRDLPLITTLTLIVTLLTVASTSISESASKLLEGSA